MQGHTHSRGAFLSRPVGQGRVVKAQYKERESPRRYTMTSMIDAMKTEDRTSFNGYSVMKLAWSPRAGIYGEVL